MLRLLPIRQVGIFNNVAVSCVQFKYNPNESLTFSVKKSILILACTTLFGFTYQNEPDKFIMGDFNGDGVKEKAWIKSESEGQVGDGEREEYRSAIRRVLFSNKLFPEINIRNASSLFNIGDVNKNQTDEILVAGYHDLEPFSNTYSVYTFDLEAKSWRTFLNVSAPVRDHGSAEKWVFSRNDTVFYWSSILQDYSIDLKDTLRWIEK